ncbi:MAG: outer membrane protein assembly factor BamD [Thermodesulfovibrionales bacterium]
MRRLASLMLIAALALSAGCSKKAVKPEEEVTLEEQFARANSLLEDKRYDEARARFEEVKMRDSGMAYAPLAQLRVADSYIRQGEPELAIAEYRHFLESYPTHRYASYAQYQIAITYYGQIDSHDRSLESARLALAEFERLNRLYPRNPYRDTVAFNIQRTRDILADHEFMVGEFYFRKGSYEGALGRLLPILSDYPGYAGTPRVLGRIAESYKGLGKDDEAMKYLGVLERQYPESDALKDARRTLSRNP